MAPDLTYTGTSPDSAMSCPTENGDDSPSRLDFLGVNHDNSKEFTDIMVLDFTEDKPLAYHDPLSRYTTILSSTCSSIKGASDDDDNDGNKDPPDLVSGKPCLPPEMETPPADTID